MRNFSNITRRFYTVPFFFLCLTAAAQETETPVREIAVTGKFLNLPYKKVNENVTLITKKEIENAPSKNIDDLLQQYAGMDIRRRGSNGVQSDISVRGGTFEQVLIFLNGIRMNDSQTGHNSMHIPVDLADVERVEIIKGPSARRFGNGAFAVVNIITKTSSEENVKISAEGGDFSTYKLGLSTHFGNEKFTNFFSINSGGSEGYRHNTDSKINNIFYQNQYKINNGTIQFQAGFSEKKFGANGFYASPAATEQYEETQASVVSIGQKQNFGNFSLNSNIFWRRGQDLYLFNREKPEIYRNMHIGNNVGAEVNGSYKSSLGTTGLGAELRKEFLASNNLGNRDRFISQVFLEHHFSLLNDRLQLSPGISWANYSNSGNFFYPGIDAGFDFNENHKIYGNLSKTHRVPTFTDLYYVSKTEQGNPDLKPESALSYELGYRFLKNNILGKVSLFGRHSNDAIDWVKNSAAEKWAAQNIGNIETKGLEAEFSQNFDGFFKGYSVSYTFTDNKLKTETAFSRYALDQLKHQFIAKLDNRIFKNFNNQLVYRFLERATGYSYHLLDEKLSYQHKNFEVFALINNLTNTDYTEAFGVPMPGIWFHLGFSWNIKFN